MATTSTAGPVLLYFHVRLVFFFEDDAEPDVQRRIAGRQISWNILQDYGISAIGMLPPPGNYHRWRRLMLWESK